MNFESANRKTGEAPTRGEVVAEYMAVRARIAELKKQLDEGQNTPVGDERLRMRVEEEINEELNSLRRKEVELGDILTKLPPEENKAGDIPSSNNDPHYKWGDAPNRGGNNRAANM